MLTDDNARRIAALADEAAVEPSRFAPLLALISDAVGAHGAALFTPALDPEGRQLGVAHGAAADALPAYAATWAEHDAWLHSLMQRPVPFQPGQCHLGEELLPVAELRRTPFFNDFLRQHEIESIASLVIADGTHGPAPHTHLSLFRPTGAPAFDAHAQRELQALWPVLRRAVDTYWILRKAREFDRVVESAVDALPQPTWLLHEDATIAYTNAAAQRLASTTDWVRGAGRRLAALGDLDAAALRDALRVAATRGIASTLPCARMHGGRACHAVLRVAPLPPSSAFVTAWPLARALLSLELPPGEDDLRVSRLERLARSYRLTPAECRVLQHIVDGKSVKLIAHELHVSHATVRTHVQALLGKTACRRQVDLVRLALAP